jgi:alkylation response protein AidB-like acyl-CoA dehydrogenase
MKTPGIKVDPMSLLSQHNNWAATAGQRVVHTAVHQHGGMGVDRDYPLHRHFLYVKQIEFALGGRSINC